MAVFFAWNRAGWNPENPVSPPKKKGRSLGPNTMTRLAYTLHLGIAAFLLPPNTLMPVKAEPNSHTAAGTGTGAKFCAW